MKDMLITLYRLTGAMLVVCFDAKHPTGIDGWRLAFLCWLNSYIWLPLIIAYWLVDKGIY